MLKNKASWKVKCILVPGQKGTAGPYNKYGEDLVCVRYRYNEDGFRIKTVELVVDNVKIKC
jgi:hypothetical protein